MKKFVIIALLLTPPVFADKVEKPNVVYKKITELDFEEMEIEGELVKPQGALVLERNRAVFNPLIKLRENFNVEMTESIKDIQ